MIPESPEWIVTQARADDFHIYNIQAERIYGYLELLLTWSERISLIGPKARGRIWEDHLLESMWLHSLLPGGGTIADLGSGAGIPGLVLACLEPERPIHLWESRAKKTRFLEICARKLGLDQVRVVNQRISDKNRWPGPAYPIIVSRAAAKIENLLPLAGALAGPGTRLMALVGREDLEKMRGPWLQQKHFEWNLEAGHLMKKYGRTSGLAVLSRAG